MQTRGQHRMGTQQRTNSGRDDFGAVHEDGTARREGV